MTTQPGVGDPASDLEYTAVVIYSKPGCHLCDEAKPLVQRLAAQFQLPVAVVNILEDEHLTAAYRFRIPVVRYAGTLLDEGRVTDAALRRTLTAALTRPSVRPSPSRGG